MEKLSDKMRNLEQSLDRYIDRDKRVVVRLDGRGFTSKIEEWGFYRPFDISFHEGMSATTKALMRDSGFKIDLGYTQSDEISLLLSKDENTFNRKEQKVITSLAGLASAAFTNAVGKVAAFDARICPCPDNETVLDYFEWRVRDAERNCLNGICYWKLREDGLTARAATAKLSGMKSEDKTELLTNQYDFSFENASNWTKYGKAVFFESVQKKGLNPLTGEEKIATRRVLKAEDVNPYTLEETVTSILEEKE